MARNKHQAADPFLVREIQLTEERKILKNPFSKDKTAEEEIPDYLKNKDKDNGKHPSALDTAKSQEIYNNAEQLAKAGETDEAINILKDLIKKLELDDNGKRKKTIKRMVTNEDRTALYTDAPLREDAMFLIAELLMKQERLPKAEEYYLAILKDYPSTRYLKKSTERLFEIAGKWMDLKVASTSDIVNVEYKDDGTTKDKHVRVNQTEERNSFFNFTDKTKPRADIEGRGLEALKAVWMNDPTGPLADDALMLAASHYLRIGHYQDAADTYKILREEYPNSPHIKDAYILASHVSQVSYQGPAYEDKSLQQSRELKRSTLQQFPDLTIDQSERIQKELKTLDDAVVLRDIERARLYMKKGKVSAAEVYCNAVLNQHPNSPYTKDAREILAQVQEERANPGWFDRTFPSISPIYKPTPWDPQQPTNGNDLAPGNQPGLKKVDRMPTLRSISFPSFKKRNDAEPTASENGKPDTAPLNNDLSQEPGKSSL
jgi:TolA-binding protein